MQDLRPLVDGTSSVARPLTTPAAWQQLRAWNDTLAAYPADACLHHLFEGQAARTPGAIAAMCGGKTLTYEELNVRANQLAHHLIAHGVRRETPVGICVERSLDMLVALTGTLKAGAAYVPLDPSYPAAHLALMLEDTAAPVVLTHERLINRLPASDRMSVRLDADREMLARERRDNPAVDITPDSAAYVIYTSGSTGRPKGVVGLHRGAVNRAAWMWREYPFGPDEVCCNKTSLNFVDSVAEIFVPLLRGVPLLVVPDDAGRNLFRLVNAVADARVTRLVLVPSLLRDMLDLVPGLDQRLDRLRLWISSGEALSPALCERFYERLPGARLLNVYGSTEVSADATCFATQPADPGRGSIPIGRPIANTEVFVLDEHLRPVPAGVTGELHVGGVGLARGYYNRPDLTAEKFIPHPWGEPGARLYKTGDRARWLPDGTVEFVGRVDHQVKIRGFRVEIGDIETTLADHHAVRQVAVLATRDSFEDLRLVAYVVPRDGALPAASELRNFCRGRLPQPMVPAAFVVLDRLPLTPSGKINRAALPAPEPDSAVAADAVPPRTPLEAQLASVWQEILGVEQVGVHDDFFDLGGHSLLAARLFTRLEAMLGRTLPLGLLAEAPTIARLSEALTRPAGPETWSPLVPLQPHGSGTPFFLVHGISGDVVTFTALARHLAPDHPVYGIRAPGSDGVVAPLPDVETMAARYIEVIRTIDPHGPYLVGGYSSGGSVALEMAQQLRAQGRSVLLLVIIDSPDLITGRERRGWRLRDVPAAARNVACWAVDDDFFRAGPRAMLHQLRSKGRLLRALVTRRYQQADIRDQLGVWRMSSRHAAFLETHNRAIESYTPREYTGPILLVRARTMPLFVPPEQDLGWGRVARGALTVRVVPAAHDNILREPRVACLAAQIRTRFAEALHVHVTSALAWASMMLAW